MDKHIISFEGATISQDKKVVLREVSFSLFEGDFVYLIGRTGTGKSSLLKTLYGDLKLREGKGKVEGRKSLIDKHPEVIGLIRSYKKKTLNISNIKISRLRESEHGIKVHSSNVPKVLKDHDLRLREERNRKRRKSSMTESV